MTDERRSTERIARADRAGQWLAAPFILCLVAACASSPQWERADASAYETQNDIEACWAAAKKEAPDLSIAGRPQFGTVHTPGAPGGRGTVMVLPVPPTGDTGAFDADVRQRQLSDDCMKARGYRAAER